MWVACDIVCFDVATVTPPRAPRPHGYDHLLIDGDMQGCKPVGILRSRRAALQAARYRLAMVVR